MTRLELGWKPSDPNSLFFSFVLCTSSHLTKHVTPLNCSFHRYSCDTLPMTLQGTVEHVSVSLCDLHPLGTAGWSLVPGSVSARSTYDEVADTVIIGNCFLCTKLPCLINDRINFHQVSWWILQDVQEGPSFQPRIEIPYRYMLAPTNSET